MQPVDPDHAGDRIDVEENMIGAEAVLQQQVDEADLGARQHDPRHHEQDARDHERARRTRHRRAI